MNPALILKHACSTLIKPVLCCLIIMQLGTGFVIAAESDDSVLFVEALTAYQKQDYLLAIERIGVITHLFPDSPLRDVALLLLARSALKSGDNELAAKTVLQFNDEFTDSPLSATVEEELQRLGIRLLHGDKLLPTDSLRSAALKVRNEHTALDIPVSEKPGQGGPATDISAVVSNGRYSAAPEINTLKRLRATVSMPAETITIAVGQRGVIPFEVLNPDGPDDEYMLETHAPLEFEAFLYVEGRAAPLTSPVSIRTIGPVKGSIIFRMPPDRVDGHKSTVTLRLVSTKDRNAVQTRETVVIAASPLVRVIAKPEKPTLARGERSRYRVTVLNAGLLPARDMLVRVLLPNELEFLGDAAYRQDAAGGIVLDIDALDTGKLAEFILNVRVRNDSPIDQELRCRVEVTHTRLQTKEIFTSAAAMVQNASPELP